MVLLALIIVLAYGYWSLTNDSRMRRATRNYFRSLTGGRVEIGKSHFSLFGGLELSNVRLNAPGQKASEPFFRARNLLLRHNPWKLLLTGKIEPTEVICIEPVVVLEYDVQSDTYSFQRFFSSSSGKGGSGGITANLQLPPIRIRQARLKWVDVDGNLRLPFDEMPITLTIVPAGVGICQVTFEEQQHGNEPVIRGQFSLNQRNGEIKLLSGSAPIPNLDRALPGKYRQWRQRYNITGEVRIKPSQLGGSGGGGVMDCELADVSLKLPPSEGGLELLHVVGTISFDDQGVTLKNVSGIVPQASNGRFEVSGRYDGYGADNTFNLKITGSGMSLPEGPEAANALSGLIGELRRQVEVSGRGDLSAQIRRLADGRIIFEGMLQPQGMSASFRQAPYRIDDLRGAISISSGKVELRHLTGRRDKAAFYIDGALVSGAGEITIKATDLVLDEQFRAALPSFTQRIWDMVNPSGRLSGEIRLLIEEDDVKDFEALLELTGAASAWRRCGWPRPSAPTCTPCGWIPRRPGGAIWWASSARSAGSWTCGGSVTSSSSSAAAWKRRRSSG